MDDVIVIGAGIVGCAAARSLAAAGLKVTVLEERVVAAAASGRNAGSVQHPLDAVRAPLYAESVAIHQEHGAVAARPAGLLVLTASPELAVAAAAPFPELAPQVVDGGALRAVEPGLAEGLSGCLLQTGYPAVPAVATRRLADTARGFGARIEEGVRAAPAIRDGRVVGASTPAGLRPAGAVLVAGGAWSSELLDPSGRWRPVLPVWGVTVEVTTPVGVVHRIEEWDASGEPDGLHFEATPFGATAVLGATQTLAPPDEPRLAAAVRARAERFLPGLAGGDVVAVRACPRPAVPADGLPLLGPVPGVEGLFVATGHGPYGISLGPASGRIAADAIISATPVPRAFRADRPVLGGPEPVRWVGR